MKVNAVILNYNDADTVETLVRSICGYEVLEYIILVDNHSQDDSRQKLQQLACEYEKSSWYFWRKTEAMERETMQEFVLQQKKTRLIMFLYPIRMWCFLRSV